MAETAGQIVRDALTELTVQAAEQTVPAVDLETGVRYLNRMLSAWAANQIDLGYTFVDSPNDKLTVPAGAIEGIVFNLAIRLASQYDVPIGPALSNAAMTSMDTVRMIGVKTGKANFPSTLPIGSGNEDASGIYPDQRFFDGCCEDEDTCGTPTNNGDSNGM
jgi:hypothetical protein